MSAKSTIAVLVITALAGGVGVACGPSNTEPDVAAVPGDPKPNPGPVEPKPAPPRPGPTDTGDPPPEAPPQAQ